MTPFLNVSNLHVSLPHHNGMRKVIDGVSFTINKGEIFGIVGESGSGKTITCTTLLKLLPKDADVQADALHLGQVDLAASSANAIRGKRISMIFQDPAAALNPVFTVGQQIEAVLKRHTSMRGGARKRAVLEALGDVELPSPLQTAKSYPHQLSGGMQQRVMIAMALAAGAELLIADEPTTALDVTVQAKILELLNSLRQRLGLTLIFVSHDLAVIAQLCDRVAVMLAGRIVESGSVQQVIGAPEHEYTRALINSSPGLHARGKPLPTLAAQLHDEASHHV